MEANKMHFKTTAWFTNKAFRAFLLHCVTLYCFYDVNLTISPLDRPVTAEFKRGFPLGRHLSTSFV